MVEAYPFIEISMACSDCAAMERFWVEMFDAKVIFRGEMMSQAFSRIIACGITLVFREDPDFVAPKGPGAEWSFRDHLGLRVANLDASVTALEAKGAKFVLTPAIVREMQKRKQEGGRPFLETTFIAAPLTRARIDAGEFRHDVAILVGPDNLWIELNEIREPDDTAWYPHAPV